jgi:hypothetical protein
MNSVQSFLALWDWNSRVVELSSDKGHVGDLEDSVGWKIEGRTKLKAMLRVGVEGLSKHGNRIDKADKADKALKSADTKVIPVDDSPQARGHRSDLH